MKLERNAVRGLICLLMVLPMVSPGSVLIDGSVSGGEGWTLLTEDPDARPVLGGDNTTSDFIGESAAYTYGDGSTDTVFTDNRADIISVLWAADDDFFYLAVRGPTVPFNSFSDAGGNNDQGDLYVAIDAAGGTASGSRTAATGHDNYGAKAVDFLGWTPTHVVGLQYVDNGGGGGGYADIENLTTRATTGEAQNQGDGGFDWHGGINGSASYDTVNNNAGEFEVAIPWSLLGLPTGGPDPDEPIRLMAYTTQNSAGYDVYDSGPGVGNGSAHEQVGDAYGDDDTAGQMGPGDGTARLPGSNPVTDSLSAAPSHNDEVDTIEEYYQVAVDAGGGGDSSVPEPSTFVLLGVGFVMLRSLRGIRRKK